MKRILFILPLLGLTACQSIDKHALFRASVTLGEQIGLETHPEATPFIRIAVPAICAAANGTNVSAGSIVDAVNNAGITNQTARIILNGGIALFNSFISGFATNSPQVALYAQDLCVGLQAGLPQGPMVRHNQVILPPHLK